MRVRFARPQNGFSLIELIVTTALLASLAATLLQFIIVFYRYRLVDGITTSLMSQTERVQQEFQFYCNNASSIRMYSDQQQRLQDSASTSGNEQPVFNYFEAKFTIPGQPSVTRGIAFDPSPTGSTGSTSPTSHSLLIYSYDPDGNLTVNANHSPNPVVLCLASINYQGNQGVFGFRNHVPYMKFTLILPSGIPQGSVNSSMTENFDITAYAKPYYMQ